MEKAIEIAMGVALLVMAAFLVVAVLLQSGKDKSLSGALGGGNSESFFSKSGSATRDKILSRITLVVAIIFVVLVIVAYIYVNRIFTASAA